ncbi:hypothetical protein B0A69_07400 [Chryseobacterium shigense]|uniref:Uncharacterized protein n=1 Tax=Chryseobacterium shigense TaxID=297244 RepID=A0A1N7I635_9FLAO|nr:hypothetical protein [Chryseobacterium shigense]PQA95259.1 hypothetical protein B0A69_07400 [Chryseobacterium shigense]SIS32528.1 hypothetical protein SAMN05421639_102253 [Chryseobacterium shigense]
MGRYMICIELQYATFEDYQSLHKAMANINAPRSIQDLFTGEWFKLPRSQYHYVGIIQDKEIMLNLVRDTVQQISQNYQIVVTGDDGSAWVELEKIII